MLRSEDIKEKLEEKREEILRILEEMFHNIIGEIFGSPFGFGKNKELLPPTRPNMEIIEKYFTLRRKF